MFCFDFFEKLNFDDAFDNSDLYSKECKKYLKYNKILKLHQMFKYEEIDKRLSGKSSPVYFISIPFYKNLKAEIYPRIKLKTNYVIIIII